MDDVLKTIGDIGWVTAAVGTNLFVILYTVLAKWWKTQFGRHLFFFMLNMALIMDYALFALVYPDFEYRMHIRAVLLPALGLLTLQRVWILISVQIRKRRTKRDASATGSIEATEVPR